MKKEFIPYQQALALKELGFDEPCLSYYEGESFSYHLAMIEHSGKDDYIVPAPLYQQAFRWFREKYGFYLILQPSINNDFTCVIWTSKGQYHIGVFLSYEEAELACLKKLIEIVKQ